MAKHTKTRELIDAAIEVLKEYQDELPMTLRQVYYELVSRQVIMNVRSRYNALSKALVFARKEGIISWEWIEDRLRRPRSVSMWDSFSDFGKTVIHSFRRNVWEIQHEYIEVWLEKDALAGIFERVLNPYGITLNVGRGYDGWDSINNAAMRYLEFTEVSVLYFGDFDPSGEDMFRSFEERLGFFECFPKIVKCALNMDDIRRYKLPPALAKKTDTRAKKFIEKHGDVSVELDALPLNVLKERIRFEVEKRMDMVALEEIRVIEEEERRRLRRIFESDN